MSEQNNLEERVKLLEQENAELRELLYKSQTNNTNVSTPVHYIENSILIEAQRKSNVGFWNYNFADKAFTCSDEIYRILEIPVNAQITVINHLSSIFQPEELQKLHDLKKQFNTTKTQYEFNLKLNVRDGSIKHIHVRAFLKKDEQNNLLSFSGTVIDVTEEHFKSEKLKENERLFRSLFNNLTDIFIIFELETDANGNVVDYIYKDVNPVFEMKFDLKKSEILHKKLSQQVQLFQQFHPALKITALTREPQQNSFFVPSLDSFVDVLIYSPSDSLVATIWRDVSLMVEANSSLKGSEEKYRQIFSIGKDGLIMIDFFSGKIIEVNPAACKIFDRTKDEMLQLLFKELTTTPNEIDFEILEKKSTNINTTGIKNNGTEFPIEAALSYFNWSGRKVAIASIRDTTERTKAQKELIKSEKKFKQLFDYSNDAILILKDFKIIDYNQKTQTVFNLNSNDLLNQTLWQLSPTVQPGGDNSRAKILELIQQSLQGNQLHFEWVFQKGSKSTFYADIKLSPIFFENEKIIQVIVRDVSPRKQSEEKLIQKENRWKRSLEISSTGVWDWNVVTNEVYFSQVWKKIIGYENDEFPNQFEEFEKRIHPDDIQQVYASLEAFFEAKIDDYSVNFRMRCKNGTFKWINSRGKVYSYTAEGKPERFIGTHSDITKYKVAEQNLIDLNEQYQQAAEVLKTGYWRLDLKTMLFNGNYQTFSIFGMSTHNQVTLKKIEELVHPEDQSYFISQFISKETKRRNECFFRILMDNQTRYIFSSSNPIYENNKTLIGYQGVFQDVTNICKNGTEKNEDQKLVTSYLEKNSQAIIAIQDSAVLFSNNKFTELTGYNSEEIEQNPESIIDIIVPEDKAILKNHFANTNTKSQFTTEIRLETKFKRVKWIDLQVTLTEFKGLHTILYILNDITEKKKIEANLVETQNKLNYISQISPVGIAFLDLKLNFTFINTEFTAITGYTEKNHTKYVFADLFSQTDSIMIQSAIERIKQKELDEFINEIELKNNIWTLLKISPVWDKTNNLQYFILFLDNIDLVKKQIDMLSEENLLHKSIITKASWGIGLFNPNKILVLNNQKFIDLLEADLDLNKIPEFDDFGFELKKHSLTFEKVLQSSDGYKILQKNAAQKTLLIELINISFEESIGLLAYVYDITEETNRKNHLLAQLEKFESIFNNSPLGIALVDKNRSIVMCNKAYSNILGFSTEVLQQKRLDELIQTENLTALITNFSELFAGVFSKFNQTLQMVNKEGEKRWINSSTSQLMDRFNEVLYAIQVIDDITDRKKNEYNIINHERIKTLSYLSNIFAHEFNNQLMAMYGNAYLLKSNLTDESLGKYADSLFTTISKSSELTHNLLSFSKNSRRINLIVNVPSLINEIIEEFSIPANIDVKTYFDNNNEIVLGDTSQLQRAFKSIIENAIEAMEHGGEFSIETKTVYFEEEVTNAVAGLEKGKYLRISINDTGKGISTADLGYIFDPFFSTKLNELNAGLGLTIAQKMITEHNGTIKVNCNDSGSTFMIYLPQPDESFVVESVQPDEQLIVKGTANLLTIDDEDVVRIVTGELLKKLGYNVFSFSSGAKAVQFYKENKNNIDLVVLDKHMPEMDGIEVYRKLKELNPLVKVVLLTGFNIDSELQEIFEHQNNSIIQKPVNVEKLSKAISSLLVEKNK